MRPRRFALRLAPLALAGATLVAPALTARPADSAATQPRVAFVRFGARVGHPRVLTIPLQGGSARPVRLPGPGAEGPAWSPRGSRLAFVSGANVRNETFVSANVDLYVAHADGTRPRRLTHDEAREAAPSWSPNGKRLAFVRADPTDNRSSLWIVDANGRRPRRLTFGNIDVQPSWSPRGNQIVFVRIAAGSYTSGLWRIRPDGSRLRRLLRGFQGATHPLWSPDGSRLLLTDGKTLFTVAPNGRARRTLVRLTRDSRGALEDPQPAWSRDGRWIVFCQFRPTAIQRSDIWIVGWDGTGLRRLTRSPGLDTDPSIEP